MIGTRGSSYLSRLSLVLLAACLCSFPWPVRNDSTTLPVLARSRVVSEQLSSRSSDGSSRSSSSRTDPLLLALVDGTIQAVDPDSGRLCWSFDTGSPLISHSGATSQDSSSRSERVPARHKGASTLRSSDSNSTPSSSARRDYSDGEDDEEEDMGEEEAEGIELGKEDDVPAAGAQRGDMEVFPGADGTLYAVHATEGIQRLPVTAKDLVLSSPSLTPDDTLLLGSHVSTAFLLHPETGEVMGRVPLGEKEGKEEVPGVPAGAAAGGRGGGEAGGEFEGLQGGEGEEGRAGGAVVGGDAVRDGKASDGGGHRRERRGGAHRESGLLGPGAFTSPPPRPSSSSRRPIVLLRTDFRVRAVDVSTGREKWNVSYAEVRTLGSNQGLPAGVSAARWQDGLISPGGAGTTWGSAVPVGWELQQLRDKRSRPEAPAESLGMGVLHVTSGKEYFSGLSLAEGAADAEYPSRRPAPVVTMKDERSGLTKWEISLPAAPVKALDLLGRGEKSLLPKPDPALDADEEGMSHQDGAADKILLGDSAVSNHRRRGKWTLVDDAVPSALAVSRDPVLSLESLRCAPSNGEDEGGIPLTPGALPALTPYLSADRWHAAIGGEAQKPSKRSRGGSRGNRTPGGAGGGRATPPGPGAVGRGGGAGGDGLVMSHDYAAPPAPGPLPPPVPPSPLLLRLLLLPFSLLRTLLVPLLLLLTLLVSLVYLAQSASLTAPTAAAPHSLWQRVLWDIQVMLLEPWGLVGKGKAGEEGGVGGGGISSSAARRNRRKRLVDRGAAASGEGGGADAANGGGGGGGAPLSSLAGFRSWLVSVSGALLVSTVGGRKGGGRSGGSRGGREEGGEGTPGGGRRRGPHRASHPSPSRPPRALFEGASPPFSPGQQQQQQQQQQGREQGVGARGASQSTPPNLHDELSRASSLHRSGGGAAAESVLESGKPISAPPFSRVGRLLVGSSVLGFGSHGTVVLEGWLEGRPIAIKRLLKQYYEKAEQEISALITSDEHPCIVRCFAMEEDGEFVYVALERCAMSLWELIQLAAAAAPGSAPAASHTVPPSASLFLPLLEEAPLWEQDGTPTEALLQIMRDVVAGLSHVHHLRIIHRDLKPHNVLVTIPQVTTAVAASKLWPPPSSSRSRSETNGVKGAPMDLATLLRSMSSSSSKSSFRASAAAAAAAIPPPTATAPAAPSYAAVAGSGSPSTAAAAARGTPCSSAPSSSHDATNDESDAMRRLLRDLLGSAPFRAKLSDMGISKRLSDGATSLDQPTAGLGSSGWQAPEQLLDEDQGGRHTRAMDLFSLGCLLFVCLSRGQHHPFGGRYERDSNILAGRADLFPIEHLPEAVHLIAALLQNEPSKRPSADEVTRHPLFWDSETRLSFLRDASDRVEVEDKDNAPPILEALEATAVTALGGYWDQRVDWELLDNLGKYRKYNYGSVRDLLRVIRNKSNHFRELPQELQELMGPIPHGFERYFRQRFPSLLLQVYIVMRDFARHDAAFHRYFKV